jgi:hypothetical protein
MLAVGGSKYILRPVEGVAIGTDFTQDKHLAMPGQIFKIDILKVHWLENFDDLDDRCAHGKIRVTIADEIVVDNSADPDDWWSLSASALHLLRTLESDHTETSPVAECLVPSEGHHINHLEGNPIVHIETVYPIEKGRNWWVIHSDRNVRIETETGHSISIPFADYKQQVLSFVDSIEEFYKTSKPKNMPNDKYDRDAYIKFWEEWKYRRSKWQ